MPSGPKVVSTKPLEENRHTIIRPSGAEVCPATKILPLESRAMAFPEAKLPGPAWPLLAKYPSPFGPKVESRVPSERKRHTTMFSVDPLELDPATRIFPTESTTSARA